MAHVDNRNQRDTIGATNLLSEANEPGMKKYVLLFAVCVLPLRISSQGFIVFGNRVSADGLDAPVLDTDCVSRLAGPTYLAQAYVGFAPDILTPLGSLTPFRTGEYAGYIASRNLEIPGTGIDDLVYVQIRAWEANAGSTYEEAVSGGARHGFSNIVPVWTQLPPGPGNSLVGLQSFCLVPEPSSGALALLAAVSFGVGLWRRRMFSIR